MSRKIEKTRQRVQARNQMVPVRPIKIEFRCNFNKILSICRYDSSMLSFFNDLSEDSDSLEFVFKPGLLVGHVLRQVHYQYSIFNPSLVFFLIFTPCSRILSYCWYSVAMSELYRVLCPSFCLSVCMNVRMSDVPVSERLFCNCIQKCFWPIRVHIMYMYICKMCRCLALFGKLTDIY